jgi:hypothetical protein
MNRYGNNHLKIILSLMTIKKTTPDNGSPPKKKPAGKTLSPRQQKVIEILTSEKAENGGKMTK